MAVCIPATVMRGGTSKGLYFLASDLPADTALRDQLLLAAMGSPDPRQIDGMGGAHPLTSKVAVISPSDESDVDVNYLFLQVVVDQAVVSSSQNCGNILAGVAPFAVEKGIVEAEDGETSVSVRMQNSGGLAVIRIRTPDRKVTYDGDAEIDGVPGRSAPVMIEFADVAGSSCGALLPTGQVIDEFDGAAVTCIDNGMPVVIMRASDFDLDGSESPEVLEANGALKSRVESIRIQAGRMMNLGDVTATTVPKMCLVAPPFDGGVISTRTFIPHRVHESIGVLGAISVAAACCIPGSIAADVSGCSGGGRLHIEHPSGHFTVEIDVDERDGNVRVRRAALLRTARKLMEGMVFVPGSAGEH